MGLEMFAPAEKQAKTFAMPMKFVIQKNAQIALKNMGIYNGSLGLALLTSLLLFQGMFLPVFPLAQTFPAP
jgi:putative membrane protein